MTIKEAFENIDLPTKLFKYTNLNKTKDAGRVRKELFPNLPSQFGKPKCKLHNKSLYTIDQIIGSLIKSENKWTVVSRSKRDYVNSKANQAPWRDMSHKALIYCLDWLENNQYIRQNKGNNLKKLRTTIKPTNKFWILLEEITVVYHTKPHLLVLRKYSPTPNNKKAKKDVWFKHTKTVKKTIMRLEKIAEKFSEADISPLKEEGRNKGGEVLREPKSTFIIQVPENSPEFPTKKISKNRSIIMKLDCTLQRIFVEDFKHGGRFYGDHQQLSKEERATIHINGKPTVELDYSSLHPRMLYHMAGSDPSHDPYILMGDERTRSLGKCVLMALINSETVSGAKSAFRSKVSEWVDTSVGWVKTDSIREPRKEVRQQIERRKLFDELGYSVDELFESAIEVNDEIKHYFFKDMGLELQYKDSCITEKILEYFVIDRDIIVLPVHDSYIIQEEYKDDLERIMKLYYKRAFGFEPTVH